jgi:hypothetical protein
MYVVRGRLDPEVGAMLMRAVEAAADALYRRERAEGAAAEGGEPDTTPEQRRADALGLLAERALAVGFGGDARGEAGGEARGGRDGGVEAPLSGSRAERYQVVLHVEEATLRATGEPGQSELEDGTRVSAETSRRVACDASVVEVRHASDGRVLDVGRRTRTIPPAIRRALEARDRGCRFPGCGSRFTDAHHVVHWADGGGTKLDNLILTCRVHHRLLHEGGWRVELNPWPGGRPVFYDPRGLPAPERPPEAEAVMEVGAAGAADALIRANRSRGINPSWDTASCRWVRPGDIPLDVLDRAYEAA